MRDFNGRDGIGIGDWEDGVSIPPPPDNPIPGPVGGRACMTNSMSFP